ncbi:MAG: NAD(P)H-dependent oxidoreductase [Bacteroidales bacterium]
MMTITVIKGFPDDTRNSSDNFVDKLCEQLILKGVEIKYHDLKKRSVKNCIGCFGCWVKTPGECTVPDDSIQIRRDAINSGLIIFVSPVIMGFTSALLKNVQDKMIPLIHPYIEFVNNECHHQSRYDKYPDIALILDKTEDSDEEDYKIIKHIYQRLAINMKANMRFLAFTDQPIEEVIYEINGN